MLLACCLSACAAGLEAANESSVRALALRTSVRLVEVPKGSRVLGFRDDAVALLGTDEPAQIILLDSSTGKMSTHPVPFGPTVALDIGPHHGTAVFGHDVSMIGDGWTGPSSEFVIVKNRQVWEYELAEPIKPVKGSVWRENDQVVLLDEKSEGFVLIDMQRLRFPLRASIRGGVPISRFLPPASPTDFALIERGHVIVAPRESAELEVFELHTGRYLASGMHLPESGMVQLVALPMGDGFVSMGLEPPSLNVFDVLSGKGRVFGVKRSGVQGFELPRSGVRRKPGRPGITSAFSPSGLLWVGLSNELRIYRHTEGSASGAPKLELVAEKGIPLPSIERIDFLGGGSVALSAAAEGLVLIAPTEYFLGDE